MPSLMALVKTRERHSTDSHFVTDRFGRFDSDFEMLRRMGTLVSVGNASGAVPPFAPLKLSEKNLKLLRPVYVHDH